MSNGGLKTTHCSEKRRNARTVEKLATAQFVEGLDARLAVDGCTRCCGTG